MGCLEALETAWGRCHTYVEDEDMRASLDHLLADIEKVHEMMPQFLRMCKDSDPEFFLVLPRVMWLSFLRNTTRDSLLKDLIPHCFKDDDSSRPGSASKGSRDVMDLIEKFRSVEALLVDAQKGSCHSRQKSAWEMLICRAVMASSKDRSRCFFERIRLEPHRQKECADAVDKLMLELEKWSMELQRHCPRDWNKFVELL